MEILVKFLFPSLAFILTVGLGVWVSLTGKPYHTVLFTLHKLAALAAVVLAVLAIWRLAPAANWQMVSILLAGLAAACILALFATGALMSLDKGYAISLLVHRVATPLCLAAAFILLFLITGRS